MANRPEDRPGCQTDWFVRATLDALTTHVCVVDKDGTILAVNEAWRRFGRDNPPVPSHCFLGQNYLSVCDRATGENSREAAPFATGLRGVLKGKLAEFKLEYPCHAPADYRWFVACVTRLPGAGSACAVVAHENITERKRAEAALRESEERFRRLSEAALEGIVIHEEGVLLSANDQFCEMFGYQPDELLGKQMIPLTLAPESRDIVRRQIATGSLGPYEVIGLKKDGGRFPIEVRARETEHEEHRIRVAVVRDITERQQAQDALRESEQRFRAVVEDQTEVICRFQADGTLTFVNNVYCRFFGKSPQELIGQKWQPKVLPADRPQIEEKLCTLAPSHPVVVIENRVYSASGQVHWMQFVNRAFFDPQGRLKEIQAVGRDITERKQAEEASRKSQQLLERTFASMLSAVFVVDSGTAKILDCNPAASRIFGYSREEMLGKTTAFLHVDASALEEFRQRLNQAVEQQGFLHLDFKMKQKDGTIFPTENSVMPIEDEQGQRIAWVSVLRDITERQRAVEELRRSEERYRLLVATSLDAVLLTAPDGRILAANTAACQMFGCSEEEITRAGRSGVVDDSDPRLAAALNERDRTGRFHGELTLLRRNRSKFPAEISSAVFRDQEGEIRTSMVIRDISERKRAEEALHHLSGRLLQVQDEERRRVARELHDTVAQGLAALSLNLGLLRNRATALNPRSKKLLADSQALAEQCANEVRSSSYLLHPPILDELGLAGAVRDHADGFARRSGLRVDLELPRDLVRLPGETELALFRVLQEALANIQHHSGSKTASIRVAQTADEIRLEVRDKGRGMAPERGHPARFGRPIFPGAPERSSDTQSGLEALAPGAVSGSAPQGMGILGMRERMRQLNGRLEIQSDDRGTSVIATVPRKQETRPA